MADRSCLVFLYCLASYISVNKEGSSITDFPPKLYILENAVVGLGSAVRVHIISTVCLYGAARHEK